MLRKEPLAVGEVYHIFSRSIAEYRIFNSRPEFLRMLQALRFYQYRDLPMRISRFIELVKTEKVGFEARLEEMVKGSERLVQIIAFCLMPTHIHLILKQLAENGISQYLGNVLNSYTRFFNTKHRRKGPLWESKFKNVLVTADEQLIHLTRYAHLNAVTAHIVERPEDWEYSSYREYIGLRKGKEKLCDFKSVLDIEVEEYKKFVNDQIGYQRELAQIKKLLLEEVES